MLSYKALRDGLSLALQRAAPQFKIYFNQVQNSNTNYFFVQLKPYQRNLGFGQLDRRILVNISVVFVPDTFAQVKAADLYQIADRLNEVFGGCLKIADRYLTLYETGFNIFDSIGNYSFELSFSDTACDDETACNDLMKNLEMEL